MTPEKLETTRETASRLAASTLDYAALDCAPPPFALVKGEVRRTEGYVVVVRHKQYPHPNEIARSQCVISAPIEVLSLPRVISCVLYVTATRRTISHDAAEALFADVCADLRHGGATMRQWCETLPFQVTLARAKLCDIKTDNVDVVSFIYASGPRWIPTNERPVDETP